jgi:hypothetical protein
MTPPTASTTELEWLVQTTQIAGLVVPIARLRTALYLPTRSPGQSTIREWCWFDSGAPISVIPFHIHSQGLAWQPLAGVQTTWADQPSAIGHIDIWLPTAQSSLRGPISMLAKFPQSDPPSDPVPILLSLESLLTHGASLALWPPPGRVRSAFHEPRARRRYYPADYKSAAARAASSSGAAEARRVRA